MAFLSAATLRELIMHEGLIKPQLADRLERIEGSKYDLSVAKVFRRPLFSLTPTIGSYRLLPDAKEVRYHCAGVASFGWARLWPWFSYLVQSEEQIKMPREHVGFIFSRTSIFRGGGTLLGTIVDPGYDGVITAGLHVRWPGMWLEKGARFASIIFAEFDSIFTDEYQGVWGGDRLTTDGKKERGY